MLPAFCVSWNMKARFVKLFICLYLLAGAAIARATACTVFSLSDGETSLMGNSEDWPEEGYMEVAPASGDSFGRITFSFSDRYVQGGINDRGLAVDGTGAIREIPMTNDPEQPDFTGNIIEEMLESCADVGDVVEFCRQYEMPVLGWCHVMAADAGGNSVVIELGTDGKTECLVKEGHWQLLTNFNLSNPSIGHYPCNRYEAAAALLPDCGTNTFDAATVLFSVLQPGGTEYSHIYDCTAGRFRLYRKGDYLQALVFDVETLLAAGSSRVRLSDLPKMEALSGPDEASLISFSAPDGDYQILVSPDRYFYDPVILPVSARVTESGYLFPLLPVFLLFTRKRRWFRMASLMILVLGCGLISCDTAGTSGTDEAVVWQATLEAPGPGTWYWMVRGTTRDGLLFETTPGVITVD
jgi:choloylglycine hydrolase